MNGNPRRLVASLCAIALTLCCIGCKSSQPSTRLGMARVYSSFASITADWRGDDSGKDFVDAISVLETEESYEDTVRTAREAELARRNSLPRCIALYARVALDCWPRLEATNDATQPGEMAAAAWTAYHYSLAQLVQNAAKHGQLNPIRGISYTTQSGESEFIPITHQEFPWVNDDFNSLLVAKKPSRTVLDRYWLEPGLGVPMIAIRRRDKSEGFLSKEIPFSATGILRPATADAKSGSIAAVLDLHDPVRIHEVSYDDRQWDLARDLSAPVELANLELDHESLSSFLNPGREDEATGLRMIEPYEPGKIPVVFVHGLLSDRFTWVNLVNDLRAVPGFNEDFQIWSFQYPTGQTFIRSATEMRQSLVEIARRFDPDGNDEAMSQMVLVGHSMGGLVSKLQISESQTMIWDSVASRSVEEVNTSPEIRHVIDTMFFFEPLPFVKRVVFIGSPHQGSDMANGFLGTLGSALVRAPRERSSQLHTFVKANADVFTGDLTHHLPSSVDLLRPDNPMLRATYQLPVNPVVRLHTIIGTGRELSDGTPADGVVTVESARHPGTVSELHIDTTHTHLTSHPETTTEIVRILSEHLSESSVPQMAVAAESSPARR